MAGGKGEPALLWCRTCRDVVEHRSKEKYVYVCVPKGHKTKPMNREILDEMDLCAKMGFDGRRKK